MRDLRSRAARAPSVSAVVVVLVLVAAASACVRATDSPEAASTPPAETIRETGAGYDVDIDPAAFAAAIDNPYFPLEPGTEWVLEGRTDEGTEVDTITVTDRTKEVMGVTTTVVKDVVELNGELAEKTFDWYAQDDQGNVWYFGEDTAEYENGNVVSRSGAWAAGIDGAEPGIIVPADPKVTDSYRLEYYEGEAEDMFWVVATGVSKSVPFGEFDDAIRTLEWTPLEPKIVGEKFYAPGVGLIAEKALSGPTEIFELVEMTRP